MSTGQRVVIMSDDKKLMTGLVTAVEQCGASATKVTSAVTELPALEEGEAALAIVDLAGVAEPRWDLLRRVRLLQSTLPVIVLSEDTTIPTVIQAVKMGADGFLSRDESPGKVRQAIAEYIDTNKSQLGPVKGHLLGIVGASKAIEDVWKMVETFAPADVSILILGESGTGKELFARAIHEMSPRCTKPFVAVDCATLPDTLFESELFGFKKGSFTGAERDKMGRFEEANGGTLFLDEIGNLPLTHQVKLLRVLQERQVTRVGETQPRDIDVRLVAATNVELGQAVSKRTFREDLYYRLNEGEIHLPPLRDRRDDIGLLTKSFIDRFNQRFAKNIEGISIETLALLESYPWPGNIRELENVIKRSILLSDRVILPENLPAHIQHFHRTQGGKDTVGGRLDELLKQGMTDSGVDIKAIVKSTTELVESHILEQAFALVEGNKTKLSRFVGLDYKNLLSKIKRYGIGNK